MRKLLIFLLLLAPAAAFAQSSSGLPSPSSSPPYTVWTPAQWTAFFAHEASKVDGANGVANNLTVNSGTASGMSVTATGGTTARTLAQRASGCDAGGANCNYLDAKDYGASPSKTGTQNTSAFNAVVTAACSIVPATISVPAGQFAVDLTTNIAFDLAGCNWVSLVMAGPQATLFLPTGTKDLIHVGGTGSYTGQGVISGFSVYRTDNPTAGAMVHLDNTQQEIVKDINGGGFYTGIWVESSLGAVFNNVSPGGDNNVAGSSLWVIDRSSGNGNNSELFIANSNSRAGTRGTYTYGMQLHNVDGIMINNMHIGFTSDAAIFANPTATNDPVDNLVASNLVLDEAGYGMRCSQPGGYAGSMTSWMFAAAESELMTNDGLNLSCAALNDFTAPGMIFLSNGSNGLNISAGSKLSFPNAVFRDSNHANGGGAHVLISGGSDINLDGAFYAAGASPTNYNIDLTGSANGFSATDQNFSGAVIGDINAGSATNLNIQTAKTDQAFKWTVTPLLYAFDPSNIALGYSTNRSTNASQGTYVGEFAGQYVSTSAVDTFIGYSAGQGIVGTPLTGLYNTAIGANAGKLLQGGATQNVMLGVNAGDALTTGGNNTILGINVGSTYPTTGSNDILIGTGTDTNAVAVGSSNEINIGGLLFWNKVSLVAPLLTSCGTGSPVVDAHGNNRSGTITAGGGALASCLMTFAGGGYTTWNHCRVTSQSAVASFAYSYSLTTLTVTGTSITSDKFDYDCDGY